MLIVFNECYIVRWYFDLSCYCNYWRFYRVLNEMNERMKERKKERKKEWKNERMKEWMKEWKNEKMKKWKNERMKEYYSFIEKNKRMKEWINECFLHLRRVVIGLVTVCTRTNYTLKVAHLKICEKKRTSEYTKVHIFQQRRKIWRHDWSSQLYAQLQQLCN